MRNVITILRRELAAYFKSAIAYIFIIVFLFVSAGLFTWFFFLVPRAEMRFLFDVLLPIILFIFIPAVTMRLWSEERKENTYELLLTFPMTTPQLVAGKFLAAVVFFAAALAGTLTVPLMIAALGGHLDGRAVASAYLGALLLGTFFIAIGLFISGLFKDQIISFVVSLLLCLAVTVVGLEAFKATLDDAAKGLGTFLSNVLGVTDHYDAFAKGVIEPLDVLFFAVWTLLFLFLNGLYIDLRSRRGGGTFFTAAVALSLGTGLLMNWILVDASFGRLDLTEDKIYTVSDATKRILAQLKVPVQIKVYITPQDKMPTQLKHLERDIADKLTEMRLASGGRLAFRAIHMEAANVLAGPQDKEEEQKGKKESLEARMIEKGVQPFAVQAIGEGEMQQQLIYSSIGVAYKEKEEEILAQIMPQTLEQLEYRLVSTVYKLTRDRQPVVALVAPEEAIHLTDEMKQVYRQLRMQVPRSDDPYVYLEKILRQEKYDVRRIMLTHAQPIPENCDALVIVDPRTLNERQQWEINRFLIQGKPVFIAAQRYTWNYQVQRNRMSATPEENKDGVNPVLDPSGLGIDDDILMDENHETLTISSGNPMEEMFGGGFPVKLPMHIRINQDSMNADVSITSRLQALFYLWGTAVNVKEDVAKENGLRVTRLLSTGPRAWKVPAGKPGLEEKDRRGDGYARKQYTAMIMVEGRFRDAFKDRGRPAWPAAPPNQNPFQQPEPPPPENEPPAPPVTPADGKLILTGCAQMFHRNFARGGGLDLFLNCVDVLTQSPDLVYVRSRKPIDRAIDKPGETARVFWKLTNIVLVNVCVAAIGIVGWYLRRKSRNAYALQFQSGGR